MKKLSSLSLLLLLSVSSLTCGSEYQEGQALGSVSKKKLKEISGIATSSHSPGFLWVHNDGDAKHLFAVNTRGTVMGKLSLKDLKIDDLEDIALGPGSRPGASYLYLGDIGDNDKARDSIRVIRFQEPSPTGSLKDYSGAFESFQLSYPDGRFDAEALMIDPITGDLIIVTKGKDTRVYQATQADLTTDRSVTLSLLGTLPVMRVSAGDISPKGDHIIMRNETNAWLWRRYASESLRRSFSRRPEMAPVIGPPTEPNGEAIAFDRSSLGYYTLSEGADATIYYFANRKP